MNLLVCKQSISQTKAFSKILLLAHKFLTGYEHDHVHLSPTSTSTAIFLKIIKQTKLINRGTTISVWSVINFKEVNKCWVSPQSGYHMDMNHMLMLVALL